MGTTAPCSVEDPQGVRWSLIDFDQQGTLRKRPATNEEIQGLHLTTLVQPLYAAGGPPKMGPEVPQVSSSSSSAVIWGDDRYTVVFSTLLQTVMVSDDYCAHLVVLRSRSPRPFLYVVVAEGASAPQPLTLPQIWLRLLAHPSVGPFFAATTAPKPTQPLPLVPSHTTTPARPCNRSSPPRPTTPLPKRSCPNAPIRMPCKKKEIV